MTVLGPLALLARTRTPPIVLCYHGLGPTPEQGDPSGLMLDSAAFAGQLDAIVERGYRLVSAGELWAAVGRGGPIAAAGLAAVTFDDGLRETLEVAGPLLAERGGRGTAFLLPGLLGERHPHLPHLALVDAGDVRELAGGPFEVASHGLHHDDMTTLPPEVVARDVRESRRTLERLARADVPGFAYPFGRWRTDTAEAVDRAGVGYACACSGMGPWTRLAVPREPVFPTTSDRRLRLKLLGLHPPVSRLAEVVRSVTRR